MRRIVFYSWQSDLPNATNRSLIQTALEEAAAVIARDDDVEVEPVVDRDTQNVPGSPDIASTIFAKIITADIFVADVSIVTRAEPMRPVPNPNVLIELGYALKAIGHERVILVFNKAFGKIEELPFDLRTRRVLSYEMSKEATERASERKQLRGQLEAALRAAFEGLPAELPESATRTAVSAIENVALNRKIVLRHSLDEILRVVDSLEPKKLRDGGTAEVLIVAIDQTQEVVGEFGAIAKVIATMNDVELAVDLYRWFGYIFDRYRLPKGFSGRYTEADQDFFKFVGHEIFVTLIAFLMQEQQWQTLAGVLNEPIPMHVPNPRTGTLADAGWDYASQHLVLLMDEGRKRNRISLHADLLNKRHAHSGRLATSSPMEDFMAADFFLFLLSRTDNSVNLSRHPWRPWSCLYLERPPDFIKRSERLRTAESVAQALGLSNASELKKLLAERGSELQQLFASGGWDYPIERADIERIGTR